MVLPSGKACLPPLAAPTELESTADPNRTEVFTREDQPSQENRGHDGTAAAETDVTGAWIEAGAAIDPDPSLAPAAGLADTHPGSDRDGRSRG